MEQLINQLIHSKLHNNYLSIPFTFPFGQLTNIYPLVYYGLSKSMEVSSFNNSCH